jgi:magnesium chelatase accessory protein
MGAPGRLDFDRDGRDWPHRERSRFVEAHGLRWHVQDFAARASEGLVETVLLLHGTGASSHSWRGLAPLLSRWRVIAPDLPGHGFTDLPSGQSVSPTGMARAVAGLLDSLRVRPSVVIGHSAGAAIAIRMALDGALGGATGGWSGGLSGGVTADALAADGCRHIVSINGALLPLHGVVWSFFSPAAKLLASAPLVPKLVAWRAQDEAVVHRLLDGTGSSSDELGRRLYARLVQSPGHVAGALQMMAEWDLPALQRDLPRLGIPLHLLVGDRDRTVPPSQADQVRALLPSATLTRLPALGHIAQEEAPQAVAEAILAVIGQAASARPGVPRPRTAA